MKCDFRCDCETKLNSTIQLGQVKTERNCVSHRVHPFVSAQGICGLIRRGLNLLANDYFYFENSRIYRVYPREITWKNLIYPEDLSIINNKKRGISYGKTPLRKNRY
jgi:hypothetical protein